jgi:hypothetical protein
MEKFMYALIMVVGMVCVAAGIGLLLAFPVMWCWNYAVVAVWGLPTITWGQAWCLNFLAHVLIKSSTGLTKSN